VVVASLCAGVLLVFAWRLGLLGQAQATDGGRTKSWGIPYAPLAFFGALVCVLAAFYGIIKGDRKND
jgi:hypothetical protein